MQVFQRLTLVILMAILAGGCATRAAWDQTTVFEVAGPIEVEVDSFGGDVSIVATDEEPFVTVNVRRAAVHGPRREEEAAASIEEITYTAELVEGDYGPRLLVRTHTAHPEPHYQRAHVFIEAPRVENIIVRTKRGGVLTQGVSGRIDIETTDGEVRLMTNRALTQPVTILNQRGDIHYRVRGESTAAFDCEAIRGEVSRRVKFGHVTAEPGSRHDRFLGRLNDGTNPVTLRTIDGNIRIVVVHNPEQVGTLDLD